MKKPSSLITYLASLVIGIILLCFNNRAELSTVIVRTIGILITVPSALMFIGFFIGRSNSDRMKAPAWYTILVACAGLVLGIWMLCMPLFFSDVAVYTLGVVLILVGIAQIVFIHLASKGVGANIWWYCLPVVVIAGGFIICFIGPKSTESWLYIVTGILLIANALNGIASMGREAKIAHELDAADRALQKKGNGDIMKSE